MGSPDTEAGREANEGPQHEVEITQAFYLGSVPVTQEQYARLSGDNPSRFSSRGEGPDQVTEIPTSTFPVESVSWEDAIAFCLALSQVPEEKQLGRVYRLPTEAEWEYACRAGNTAPFHFGETLSSEQANFDGRYPYGGAPRGPCLGRSTAVGSYESNAFGLYDMHGNVSEWCADWYGGSYYREGVRRNPQGPERGTARVLRGGAFSLSATACRAASRSRLAPSFRNDNTGFRVVLVLDASPSERGSG
jgi:formylglycine-generating enzyme required for sulfatase activity